MAKSKEPEPKQFVLFDEPAEPVAAPVVPAVPVRSAPVVDNSKNGLDAADLAAYAKAMQGEMSVEVARAQFVRGVRACERGAEIETNGQIDYRKVNRLANGLLGRVESDRPEPTAAEWQAAYTALAEWSFRNQGDCEE